MSGDTENPTSAQEPASTGGGGRRPPWTILTNHGHVLLAVAAEPHILIEEIALRVGITRRATLSILKDLEEAGYVQRMREGRRTRYRVDGNRPFRHPAESDHDVGALLEIFLEPPGHGTTVDDGGR